MSTGNIKIVTASAGTGKTYRLSSELLDAVACGTPPERIFATTFTNRAAAELVERGRRRLLEERRPEDALRLMLARVGTVNSVFGKLVSDYALENGRSPIVSVIPDSAQARVFRIAADGVIGQHAQVLSQRAESFGFKQGQKQSHTDWRKILWDLVSKARLNGLTRADLAHSATRSWTEMRALMQPPAADGDALDQALRKEAEAALIAIGQGDGTQVTKNAIVKLQEAVDILRRPASPPWSLWASLSKLKAGATSDEALKALRGAASAHPRHPRLHADVETFICTMFAAAADAQEVTQTYKQRRGLVDFVDQEAEALDLLSDPEVAQQIACGTDLLMVDEFQDTSPIQLAVFMRLAALVPRTLFVGDPKQAIYGFRGADPDLVAAVTETISRQTGESPDTLDTNRRSRPALVHFTNAVFSAVLPNFGMPIDQITVKSSRNDLANHSTALHLWRVGGSNKENASAMLAGRVARLLDRDKWQTTFRMPPGATRAICGGDIAVLALTNAGAETIASALSQAGLKVALERNGLLRQAECILALAGLRVLADPTDTLAIAEILHLLEGGHETPAWLAAALGVEEPFDALKRRDPVIKLINGRERLVTLSPVEVLDRAIDLLDLVSWLPRWGDTSARHANLGALRALAREYEDECQRERLPGSAAGLAAWIMGREDAQQSASPDPDAVNVMTIHRAKGLEWPVVVLPDLDDDDVPRLFNSPTPMQSSAGIDPHAPLMGRWIRLWPWPYGLQSKDVHIDTTAIACEIGQAARNTLRSEKARLLYVALTRARDYLVLAPRMTVSKKNERKLQAGWLDLFPGALELPTGPGAVRAAGQDMEAVIEDVDLLPTLTDQPKERMPVLPEGVPPAFGPRRIQPSAAAAIDAVRFEALEIGPRLALTGHADMQALGEAVHGFLAADRPAAAQVKRLSMAERLLRSWDVSALTPRDVVDVADRFWAHIERTYPDGIWRREWPLVEFADGAITTGRADLVVQHSGGIALYDHKTFPGGSADWEREMLRYAPQLASYSAILSRATGHDVTRQAIHLPAAGTVLIVTR